MFHDFGASSLNFTIANATDFQRSFFSTDCERVWRGKAQIAAERIASTAGKILILNS
jgi:hypothetical protein